MTSMLKDLSDAGVSVWLDTLSRGRIKSGSLSELIRSRRVVGVTTNPTIFRDAISHGVEYEVQMSELAVRGVSAEEAVRTVTATDVRDAADLLRPVFLVSPAGQDGRVSIEVDPHMAHDTTATIAEARHLTWLVDRPNIYIKIPATEAGLPAITETIAQGISVNVTLIFSLARYRQVAEAYVAGLEKARAGGLDLSQISSVASFFVSRMDTEVDRRLDALGTPEARALRGRAAVANARLAYEAFEEAFSGERWNRLHRAGANKQRPLWASTGVKDRAYEATKYVSGLIAPDTVNTMPEATLLAVEAQEHAAGRDLRSRYDEARADIEVIERLGISYAEVVQQLEDEGVAKFQESWDSLLTATESRLEACTRRLHTWP
ncbi:transaldolase [Streptomyces spinosirectus]|uniref:transaldolase n=1 Tax=Streptomyces TaxID=1883 RepID=UPI000D364740|nr:MULTISPECIES: transaldolase [Streptomyces]MBY8345354.1 transaldolase [Streptomyces plumbidurans]PTM83774.1 transaldolase [Streptomyces sp. VMFN-G11Ma]UIR22721.1 transaldolase [Streptomyces spinosirectus]